ncbi:MAG: hypothetical protein FWC40_02850 [Proteobacteria bacterium]|nr:hypothetical protein [Pseudomonadota bacterium]
MEKEPFEKPNADQTHETKSGDRHRATPQRLRRRNVETAEKSFETQVSEALVARDRALVHSMIQETSDAADLRTVATNSTMMVNLMTVLKGTELHECLDRLYEYVDNDDILIQCTERRFEIDMGFGSVGAGVLLNMYQKDSPTPVQQVEWGLNGAKRVYFCLLLLPASHVKNVELVIATGKNSYKPNSNEPMASGYSHGATGRVSIAYNEGQTRYPTGDAYCDRGDVRESLSLLDTTIVHEIAHVVDASKTPYYSADSEFRDISEWKERGKADNPSELRVAIEECAEVAYPESITDDELPLAHKGAELMIEKTVTDPDNIEKEVVRAYGALGKDINGQAGKYRSAAELAEELKENSTVYRHIPRSWAEAWPWEAGKRTDMKTQIHQGYENGVWYSFINAAYDHKLSKYQFREPAEDFAERYAIYHVSEPKGKGLEQNFIDWFKDKNLHEDPPKGGGDK